MRYDSVISPVSVAGAELVELDLSTSHLAWSRAVSAFADVSGVEGGGASGIAVVGRMLEKLRLVWRRHRCGDWVGGRKGVWVRFIVHRWGWIGVHVGMLFAWEVHLEEVC